MTQRVRVHCITVTADGIGAGDDPSVDRPFGDVDPGDLFAWAGATASWVNRTEPGGHRGLDDWLTRDFTRGIGAEIMGRGKFGPQTGPWPDHEWQGWWGDEPPFHTPVFVLTHHPRPSIEMEGGNVFHFVEGSPAEVLALAREAAGDLDIRIGGGPGVLRDFLAANLIDVLHVVQVPIVLGRGVRLWDGLEGMEQRFDVEVVASPSGVTHLTFTRRQADV